MKLQSLRSEFAKYVSLNVLGMIGLSCYILADTFFIAQGLGSAGLAALNIAIPLYSLMHGAGLMIGIGGASRYAVHRAQGENRQADRVFTHACLLGLVVGVLFLLAGLFLSAPLSRLLGANDDTFALTSVYLKTLLCFGPAFLMNNVLIAFVRNDGQPQRAMLGMLLGSFFNIVFDYLLIFPAGLGMFGAAIATAFSPLVSLLVLSGHLRRPVRGFRLRRCRIRPALFGSICTPGLSAFITELSNGLVLLLFNLVILRLHGNTGVAAYGVVANLSLVAVAIYNGVAQGMQPLVSRSFGSGNRQALRTLYRDAAVLSLLIATALYALVYLCTDPFVALFNSENDPALAALAHSGMRIYFLGFWCAGFNIVSAAFFSAADRPVQGFILSILRGVAVIVPTLLLLTALLGMTGVWATFPSAEAITALVSVIFVGSYFRQTA